jgi:hypothetical protein
MLKSLSLPPLRHSEEEETGARGIAVAANRQHWRSAKPTALVGAADIPLDLIVADLMS